MAGMAWNAFGWIFAVVFIMIGVFLVAKFFKDKKDFNKKGILIRRYGGSVVILNDVFKFVFDKKRNIRYYYGKKSKAEIPADKFEEMQKDSQNKDILLIDNYAYGEYRLMGIGGSELIPVPLADKKSWYVYAQKDNTSRFDILDWINKYANLIALVGLFIVLLISFIFQGALLDKTNGAIAAQNTYANYLLESTENLKMQAEVLNQVLDKGVNLSLMLRNMKMINGSLVVNR